MGLSKYAEEEHKVIKAAQGALIENPEQYLTLEIAEESISQLSEQIKKGAVRKAARFYLKTDYLVIKELPSIVSSLDVMLTALYPETLNEEDRDCQRKKGKCFLADRHLLIGRLEVAHH